MTQDQVREAVLNIISDIAPDEDISSVKDELNLRDQLDLDSMDFLDIVMELRKRFDIEVPEDDYPQLASMASCVTYLFPLLKDREMAN
ncbi:MAG: acyl carrier protein [Nitrospinales bacterium]